MSEFLYIGNCAQAGTYESINAMRDDPSHEKVSYATLLENCPDARARLEEWGAIFDDTTDAQIKESWFLDFYTSTFEGKRCYYIAWSAYEWIWVQEAS